MKVGNVGTSLPFSFVVWSSPIGAAGNGVVGKASATMRFLTNVSA